MKPEESEDLLSMILASSSDNSHEAFDQKQLRDEVMTILLAGHETTAVALTWTWYLLARHSEVQERFQDELTHILDGNPPTLEKLSQLRYTKMILDEAMRLYPPVWLIPRKAIRDDILAGYHIPGGSDVLICTYSLHRHKQFWDNPEKFVPERFETKQAHKSVKYAYLPFGAGARNCVGTTFASMEALLALATIGQRYRLKLTSESESIKPDPLLTLRPTGKVLLTVTKN